MLSANANLAHYSLLKYIDHYNQRKSIFSENSAQIMHLTLRLMDPGIQVQKGPAYTNLTPWVTKLFFCHTCAVAQCPYDCGRNAQIDACIDVVTYIHI